MERIWNMGKCPIRAGCTQKSSDCAKWILVRKATKTQVTTRKKLPASAGRENLCLELLTRLIFMRVAKREIQ